MFFIVPGEFYTCIHISFPILGGVVIFFEDISYIMGMSFPNVSDAKFVYNQSK